MVTIPFKQISPALLAVTAFALLLAQPLWADEEPPATTSQEESVFQTLKRKTRQLFSSDPPAGEVQKEAPAQADQKSQGDSTSQKSDGRKAIDTVKKEMNKISDNISESVERDKKTLKQKFDKLRDNK